MDFTTSTAPWWYVASLAGGFTVLGGLISFLTGWLNDRRRFAREDARRYDDAIRGFVAEFIHSVISARDVLKTLNSAAGNIVPDQAAVVGIRASLEVELQRARRLLDELSIVAPVDVRDSARMFYLFLNELKKNSDADLWDSEFWVRLGAVINSTREAVGLPPVKASAGWVT